MRGAEWWEESRNEEGCGIWDGEKGGILCRTMREHVRGMGWSCIEMKAH